VDNVEALCVVYEGAEVVGVLVEVVSTNQHRLYVFSPYIHTFMHLLADSTALNPP
jgi:hypothetical protein